MNYDTIGFLLVQTVTANGALPVPNAAVSVYSYEEAEDGSISYGDII